jgi:hypothetical protein
VRGVPKAGVVDVGRRLLLDLGDRCRDGPVILSQLGRAGEGVRCYWRRCPSVSRPT